MATTVARLEATLSADTRQFDRAMDRSDSRAGSMAKTLGKAGLAGAVVGLGFAVKAGFSEFMEAEKVTAQTNAVLKSTGGVAKVSAKEVDKLATSLMKKSGVDDEQIKTGQNMLLTFTKIRNETGKGNDIFNQATKSTLNLSVAMGKDMQSSALLLGKALNDPVKGMASLGRAGVQFTEDQKDTIKGLVEGASAARALSTVVDTKLTPAQYKSALAMEKAGMGIEDIAKKLNVKFTPAQMKAAQELQAGGKTMEAQKIILKELETQFGGSAEAAGKTFGGQINIAKQSLLNLAGDGVGKLMPKLTEFATWFTATAIPKIKSFIEILKGDGSIKGALGIVGTFITETFFPIVRGILTVFKEALAAVKRVLDSHKEQVATIVAGIKGILKGIGLVFTEVIVPTLKAVFKPGGPFDIVFGLAIDIVSGVVTAIGKIVGGVKSAIAAVKSFWDGAGGKAFRKVFAEMATAVHPIKVAFEAIVTAIKWLIENASKIPSLGSGKTSSDIAKERLNPGARGAGGTGDANLMGALPVMAPFASAAAGYGLRVTSGLRPGAITANGTPSDHGIGKALDVAGSPSGMAGFFRSLIGNRSVKQAFYDPLGSIFGGLWNSYREGGHSDHVHVATYDKGGILKPGLTLAYNGTGQNEYVGKSGQPILLQLDLDGQSFARAVFDALKGENVRQGRLGRGL